jgi:hypothetical protein
LKSSSGMSNSGNGTMLLSPLSSSRLLRDNLLEGVVVLCEGGSSSRGAAVDVYSDQADQFIFKWTLVLACPVSVLGLRLSVLSIQFST